jgi:hypothetical protein
MTRTLVALAVTVGGAFFSVVSGISQAAPIAPLSAVARHDHDSAIRASWHGGRGGEHRKRSGFRRGGSFATFGGFRSLLSMLGSGQGGAGGMASLLGAGGSGGMGGITSMLGGMAGSGDMGGFASMLGGMGGSGGTGGVASMLGGTGGSGGTQSAAVGEVSQSARQACTPDAMRLCSDYIPNVGKITACMRAKSAQLSEPCRAAMNSEGATLSRSADRRNATSFRGQALTRYGDSESAANFGSGHGYGNFEADQGYDRPEADESLGGGMDFGRMIGMAKSLGFGFRGGW